MPHRRQQIVPPRLLVGDAACGVGDVREVLRHLDLARVDAVEELAEVRGWQVRIVVDSPIHPAELLLCHLVFHLVVMQVRIKHDDRVGEDIRRIGVVERPRRLHEVPRGECLDDARDFLRLSRQPERVEEGAQRLRERHAREVEGVHEALQSREREL